MEVREFEISPNIELGTSVGEFKKGATMLKSKTVSIAPSWVGIYPIMKDMIMSGTKEQKVYVCEELKMLCRLADEHNKQNEQAV